ncbi:hypothetical protein DL764_010406 [Monosporascus ibericus]|uniref:Uncharacterized protein n=1 Tax=Monosporascus ibericus TaxID=155417 RepID=A0A4Q4SSU9_9PEZI|nr:hypothetical protein DL764_010406 [Monosporascus ibericus]
MKQPNDLSQVDFDVADLEATKGTGLIENKGKGLVMLSRPEAPEKDLQSVLSLSKAWDCTVLLGRGRCLPRAARPRPPEAQRAVLRLLPSAGVHEVILIATSHRVGTFDDTSKSRMQPALHYEKLDRGQRRTGVAQLPEPPEVPRAPRRSTTTSSTILFCVTPSVAVNYTHLKQSLKIQGKFDKYLKDIREGISDEQMARDDGAR